MAEAFTYQGELRDSGGPVNETCDLRFQLRDAAGSGSQVGSTVTLTEVEVSDGLFTAELNFGTIALVGAGRWLDVGVRCPAGSDGYTWLTPRQAVTASPYALYALRAPWSGLSGVPPGLNNGDDNTTNTAGTGLTLTGTQFSLKGSYRLPQDCSGSQIAEWNGGAWACGDDDAGSGGAQDHWGARAGAVAELA